MLFENQFHDQREMVGQARRLIPFCERRKTMTHAEAVCSAVQQIVRSRSDDDETGILARAVLELLSETERLGVGEQTLGTELMRTKLAVRRLKRKVEPPPRAVIRISTK
jgi:hypothetical protein